MSKRAVIAGWSHIPFGKLDDPDTESLMARVSGAALDHAGFAAEEVDGIYVGVMNSGFQKQDFQGALVALAHPALAHVPATRLENACATGSAALYTAMDFIESGRGRVALVVGAEKMSARRRPRLAISCSTPATARKRPTSRAASRACLAASPPPISSAMAIRARRWLASRRRTTVTAWTTPMRRSAGPGF